MATDYISVTTSPRILSAGEQEAASVNKRGELIRGWPWHLQLVNEGKVFTCGGGTVTTPITVTSTAIDATLPDFMLRIPDKTTVIPLYMHLYVESTVGTLNEAIMQFSLTDPGNGTSSAADRPPVNLKTAGAGSACTARQLVTVTPTFISATEFWRWGEPASAATVTGQGGYKWDYQTNGNTPVLVGPATLNLCCGGGTALTVYVTLVYAEFTTAGLLG